MGVKMFAEKVSNVWVNGIRRALCFKGRAKCRGRALPVPVHLISVPKRVLADVNRLGEGQYIMYMIPDDILTVVYAVGVEDEKVHVYQLSIQGSQEVAYTIASEA